MAPPNARNLPQVDTAIVPLNRVHIADLQAGATRFDHWLRSASGGYVTLERIKEVSAAMPVLGNIIAAVDVCGDVATLWEHRNDRTRSDAERMLDWANLAINLIGVMPIPPGTSAARMTLRPTLSIVRQTVLRGGKDLAEALVAVIAGHLTASLMGELKPFVMKAKAQLNELLDDAAKEVEKVLNNLAHALDALASGQLTDPNVNLKAARRDLSKVSASALVHDPKRTLGNLWDAAWEVGKAGIKAEANVAVSMMPDAAKRHIHTLAGDIRAFIPTVKTKIHSLSSEDVGSVMYLLNILIRAIQVYEDKKHHIEATIQSQKASQAHKQHGDGQTESQHDQARAQKPGPSQCKTCAPGQPAVGTKPSIGFALGDETFTHTDFVLPGVIGIEWSRTYHSNFGGHDEGGPLGPRWTTPYHASFEARGQTLVYHDTSGRSLNYPQVEIGRSHHDAIEQQTVKRVSENVIELARGSVLTETYERQGERFRLTRMADRSGNDVTLTYAQGRLTGIANSAGAAAKVEHDEAGRITRIVQVDEGGQAGRTLAAYAYDAAGDLVAATDEDGAAWSYAYTHHLITRYSDRTGRGMNLAWDGTGLDARAVREWADDGTFDTHLTWHERLRLTFVTDALGNTTQQYYDIDGYPYRVVYPDDTEEWYFRDAARNVIRHVFPDGAEESFTWDARGNLTSHTARDGRTAYYVHDERDNLTGVQDPEGYRWERYYDSRGNVVEAVDPLGRITKYEYNDAGLPVAITDPKGGQRRLAWRADGQLASYTDCSGKTGAWQYDDRGRLVEAKNAAGETTRYRYEAGQLVQVTRAGGQQERFER
ncbi:DUF6531 domain-containing protein, partial [Ralstonia sp. UBA689]|uniref:DUF6531 domain-containing protein n=1 Tax=Ralstonia sp. UBA689 TaxID=1947373 RepID=UPI0025FD0606